jgi:hypothetical protein
MPTGCKKVLDSLEKENVSFSYTNVSNIPIVYHPKSFKKVNWNELSQYLYFQISPQTQNITKMIYVFNGKKGGSVCVCVCRGAAGQYVLTEESGEVYGSASPLETRLSPTVTISFFISKSPL